MSLSFFVIVFLNGLAFGMLLFLLSVGLTIIFGLLDVINLAHGSLFMVGAYVGLSVMRWSGNFGLAVAAAATATLLVGLIIEPVLLRPLYRHGHLDQVLLTLGLIYIFADLVRWIWGTSIMSFPPPDMLRSSVPLFELAYPTYRLFVIGLGLLLAMLIWYLQRNTLYGAIIRAGVQDAEMVSAIGINIERVFSMVFGVGALLAGFAGALGAPIIGLYPGMDNFILITALVVVVIGGLGTLTGSFWGSILVGMAQSFGAALVPEFSLFLVFVLMTVVLVLRPQGLLGQKERR